MAIDDATRIESAVTAMLPATKRPWSVLVGRSPYTGSWTVAIEHEASHGLRFDMGELGGDADATIAFVAEGLARQTNEVNRIAAAPPLINADDVMEIRSLAHIFNWSKLEVRAVVRHIQRWTLTDEEADWLITTIGHDGPVPSVSWDF